MIFKMAGLTKPTPEAPEIRTGNGDTISVFVASSKQIFEIFREKEQIPLTAEKKVSDKYPNGIVEWDKPYLFVLL